MIGSVPGTPQAAVPLRGTKQESQALQSVRTRLSKVGGRILSITRQKQPRSGDTVLTQTRQRCKDEQT